MKTSPKWLVAAMMIGLLCTSGILSAQQAKEAENPSKEIDRVQKKLQQVLLANQRLQEDYVGRMKKIQQITAQAKIHQKILEQIKSSTPGQSTAVQQAVQQEKIRLIAEQARKNQEMLKALRQSKQQQSS